MAGRWISTLYRCSQSHLARRLEPYGVGGGQIAFLMRLYHAEGISQDELAASLHIDKGATARALRRLEQNGCVERRRDQEDGRVNRVYLTEKARELRPTLCRILAEWNQVLFEDFAPGQRDAAVGALRRMATNAANTLRHEKNQGVD